MVCFHSRGGHRFCFALNAWNPVPLPWKQEASGVWRGRAGAGCSGVPLGIEFLVVIGIKLTRGKRIDHTTFVVGTADGLDRKFRSPVENDGRILTLPPDRGCVRRTSRSAPNVQRPLNDSNAPASGESAAAGAAHTAAVLRERRRAGGRCSGAVSRCENDVQVTLALIAKGHLLGFCAISGDNDNAKTNRRWNV
jgi:hypothetical protein